MSSVYDAPASDVGQTDSIFNPPLLSAKGRMGRIRYLAHAAWTTILIMIIGAVIASLIGFESTTGDVVVAVAYLLALVIQLIFAVKRVHDMNWPGIAAALAVIPLVNLLLVFWPGTKGANQYGPPPGPNTGWLYAGALLLPLVFIFGVLAAIAIPAFQDYTARAQVAEAFNATSMPKTAIAEHYQMNFAWPDEAALVDLGLDQPIRGSYSIVNVTADTGEIVVRMRGDGSVAQSIADGTIVFRPEVEEQFVFVCTSPDIRQVYLPRSCSGQ